MIRQYHSLYDTRMMAIHSLYAQLSLSFADALTTSSRHAPR